MKMDNRVSNQQAGQEAHSESSDWPIYVSRAVSKSDSAVVGETEGVLT